MSKSNNSGNGASRSAADLNDLFAGAVSMGTISAQTSTLLSGNLGPVVIAGASGRDTEEIEATDVTLITVLIDESSSIAGRGLEQAVCDGYNRMTDAFLSSKERESIMVALWVFNNATRVVHSYVPVADAETLDATSYRPGGYTCLYDTWCDALAANVAYAQQLRDGGTPCRSIVVVITDGEDTGSRRTPGDCARIGRDLLASEQFVLAFVGVGSDVDFRAVARSMGVPEGSIEVAGKATPAALRKVFEMVSQSAILVSQGTIAPGMAAGFFN